MQMNLFIHMPSSFILGLLDNVTVLIGIAHKNRPVGGVIHQPVFFLYNIHIFIVIV